MIRVLRKIALVLLLLFAVLGICVVLLVRSYAVQTEVAQFLASRFSKSIGAEVSIERLTFDPFHSLILHGVLVHDEAGDTLIAAERVSVGIRRLKLAANRFRFTAIELRGARLRLVQTDPEGHTNLDFIIHYLSDSKPADTLDLAEMLRLRVSRFTLSDCGFSYHNPFARPSVFPEGVNLEDIDLTGINALFEDFRLIGDTIRLQARSFGFREKSGLQLRRLEGGVVVHPNAIVINNMHLETPLSILQGDLILGHESWSAYQDFTSKVQWQADFVDSRIHFGDIGYFVSDLYGVDVPLYLSGKVTGTIKDLKGRELSLLVGDRTLFRGNISLMGLPDFDNTFIDLRVKQLSSDYADLEALRIAVSGPAQSIALPIELKRAGSLYFRGSFTGFPTDFVAFGDLTTEAGRLQLDLNVQGEQGVQLLNYEGNASAKSLDVGRIFGVPGLGTITARAGVVATSRQQIDFARIDGQVEALEYRGYTYRNIAVDGELRSQKFAGNLRSRDPNVDIDFSGLLDMNREVPLYDFSAEVYNLDLTALNLVSLPLPLSVSTSFKMSASGNGLSDFAGTISAANSFICYGDSAQLVQELVLSSLGDDDNRKLSLTSDFADFSITGKFKTGELYNGLHQMATVVMPSLRTNDDLHFNSHQAYDFSINYKAPNAVSGLFLEGLNIAPQTTLYGSFDNRSGRIEALVRSGSFTYGSVTIDNLTLNAAKQAENITLSLRASKGVVKGMVMENPDLAVKAFNDDVSVSYGWFNADGSSSGEVDFQAHVYDLNTVNFNIDSLRLTAKKSTWKLTGPAQIGLDTTGVSVQGFEMANKEQRIRASGKAGRHLEDEALIVLQSIDLGYLDSLGIELPNHFEGIANANVSMKSALAVPVLSATSGITGFAIDGIAVGDLVAQSSYNQEAKLLELEGTLTREAFKIADFKGQYALEGEEPLSGKLFLDNFDLEMINIFGIEMVNTFSGKANGEMSVEGALAAPRLKGFIDFSKARFKVDYLNVFFEFSDRIRVEEDWFGIDYKPIFDQEGNKGFVVASAFHDNFENWSYDISTDVDQFLVMNTDRSMNELFYGQARATGAVQIGGFEDFLEINIDARTGKGTSIKLPLDETSDVTLENFVHFVSREAAADTRREANLEGISLRLNIEATPDAEVQLIFDERSGDIMRGRGSGLLTIEIAPSGEFQMFGRYEITEGSYLFTLKNLINKQFQVRPGSTVAWYGNPYEADLNIGAVYNLRTPLFPIMLENRERYRTREDVNVVLNLTEKLMNPIINFDIELPQSTEIERSQLASALSTVQQLNQQVFALLILNRFLPTADTQEGATGGITGLGSATTSDFVSTQISNWLSEISNDFEIGVNYRPGDQISNQEIAVALSTQLFNERVRVSGQFGVTSPTEMQYSRGQSGLVGDFLLEYLITDDGKIRLKVFNETNPYEVFSTAGSIYTQGVGLVYLEDFDNFDEFFKKLGKLFTKDKASKAGT